ncbi:phage holin [Lactococcus formosensis]|uniref:Phage holin n=1 Tax=Lactococcus formosensis TaxID=1281486 RepID=A0A9X4P4W7_9LACT|nr:phage holin [Lactococcus formosensis]MDG6113739.1 phage holin [Lactococcus formosensis]MDG6122270.1 phage holin [Lactococcus formosensis]MDG6126457.1 phage holin [Lactococcus formosensis]MDG6131855.1 phage holin [Lactococcus formosensis]MDG6133852.1 phage holin [Lactococcus formosensis]
MIMTNKTYNVIKWAVLTVLPALSVLVGVLGKAYGWESTDLAVLTLNAVAAFLGAITGVSAASYNKQQKED